MNKERAFDKIKFSLRRMGFDDEFIEKVKASMDNFYDEKQGDYVIPDYEEFSRLLLPVFTSSETVENILKSTEILEREEFSDIWIKDYEMRSLLGEISRFFSSLVFGEREEKGKDFFFTDKYPEEKKKFSVILNEHFDKIFSSKRISKIREKVIQFTNLSPKEERKKARYLLLSFSLFKKKDNIFLKYLFIKSLVVNAGFKKEIIKEAKDLEEGLAFTRLLEDKIFSIMEKEY